MSTQIDIESSANGQVMDNLQLAVESRRRKAPKKSVLFWAFVVVISAAGTIAAYSA